MTLDFFLKKSLYGFYGSTYYNDTRVLPVLLYGAETWSLTSVLEEKLDACPQWCLRRLLSISHLQCVTNTEVLRRTNQTQLSTVLCDNRLRLFGHVARSDARMDHSRVLCAVSSRLPSHTTGDVLPANPHSHGREPLEKILSALSIGLSTAWIQAQDCVQWQSSEG